MSHHRTVAERVREVVARELGVAISQASDNAEYRADLKADSLHMVGLQMALEEEFEIAISDGEADFCETVGTSIDLITARLERIGGMA